MFIKLTRRGPNEYVQLVEAYRDDDGRPKQRTVASLGRLDQINTEFNSPEFDSSRQFSSQVFNEINDL